MESSRVSAGWGRGFPALPTLPGKALPSICKSNMNTGRLALEQEVNGI